MSASEDSITIRSLDDIAKAFNAAHAKFDRRPWFRGQRDQEWHLRPHVHRILADHPERHHEYEASLVQQFRARAPIRQPNCPDEGDYFGWLSLMRHYHLPTRLLDWSESILVAAYFAVVGKAKEHPAAIWALDPYALNASRGVSRHPLSPRHPKVTKVAEAAFRGSQSEEAGAIAIVPPEKGLRMLVQRATFTIHWSGWPLEQFEHRERFLLRFPIAEDYRLRLRSDLDHLGVNEAALFPSLDTLATNLVETEAAPANPEDFGARIFEYS